MVQTGNGHPPGASTMETQEEKKDNTQMIGAVLAFDLLLLPVIMVFLIDWTVSAPIDPAEFKLPQLTYEGPLTANSILGKADKLFQGEIPGPESVVVNKDHVYTGTSDGRILDLHKGQIRTLAHLSNDTCGPHTGNEACGRPLGMRIDSSGNLVVADADLGLFKIDPSTGSVDHFYKSTDGVGGRPSGVINDLTIASDGTIYITDTSYKFRSRDSFYILAENRPTGRLFKLDPVTNESQLLVPELHGANGVQLSHDETFILISESPRCRVMRYWLKGPQKGQLELFAELPGIPDNIRPSHAGHYWVAMAFARHPTRIWAYEIASTRPWLRRMVSKIFGQEFLFSLMRIPYGLIIELDSKGNILRSFHDPTGHVLPAVSHVDDQGTFLYLGSFATDFLARLDLRKV